MVDSGNLGSGAGDMAAGRKLGISRAAGLGNDAPGGGDRRVEPGGTGLFGGSLGGSAGTPFQGVQAQSAALSASRVVLYGLLPPQKKTLKLARKFSPGSP